MSTPYQKSRCETRSKRRSHGPTDKKAKARRQRRAKRIEAAAGSFPLPLDREELTAMLLQSLDTFAVEVGLCVAGELLEDEVARLCGKRYARVQDRDGTRYGHQPGYIILSGQKLPVNRPRVRCLSDRREIPLETYRSMQAAESMPQSALRRMIHGVSTRNYETVIDTAAEGFGVKRSSVSRAFVRASARSLRELSERRFDGRRFPVIFIDGLEYAGEMMICALGIAEDGTKHVLGLRQGGTENQEVAESLLAELRDRGLDTGVPTLFVLDGSKALAAAVKGVWGKNSVIQRCQVHKKRNVQAHLPAEHWPELARRLHEAYTATDYAAALAQLRGTAKWLARINLAAAASLREGLEETLTVVKLGVPERLRKTLSSTNVIESAFDLVRGVTRRVKKWREGEMRQRWCAAGLLRAEKRFNRVRGHKQLPLLLKALEEEVTGKGDNPRRVS